MRFFSSALFCLTSSGSFSSPMKFGKFNEEYFTAWALIAIAWGTNGSAVIIVFATNRKMEDNPMCDSGHFYKRHANGKGRRIEFQAAYNHAGHSRSREDLLASERAKRNEALEQDGDHIVPA